jgi:hypothetical protein
MTQLPQVLTVFSFVILDKSLVLRVFPFFIVKGGELGKVILKASYLEI